VAQTSSPDPLVRRRVPFLRTHIANLAKYGMVEIPGPHSEEIVVSLPMRKRGQRKSDKRDPWKLAEELRTGAIRMSSSLPST
jgi:hypothetical protein